MEVNIGLVAIAGEYEVGFSETPELLNRVAEQLGKPGHCIIKTNAVMYDQATLEKTINTFKCYEFDILCVCVGTWSEDHYLLDLLERFDKPVILWAFPAEETGSLCGMQQICCVLKELDKKYFHVFGNPDDQAVLKKVSEICRAAALSSMLKSVKIGTIGGRVNGMTEIAYDEFEIKACTGVRIVGINESELSAAYDGTDENAAAEYWNGLKSRIAKVTSSDQSGTEAVRYYFAMKRLIQNHGLEGICVKCYMDYMGKVCLGYSLLSDEGVVCGCEGDVNATVAMKILYELTGVPVHNTDLMYTVEPDKAMVFSHCGSDGFSIANAETYIHLGPVRLADGGVCALFPAKPGKVTLVNLVGRKGTYRMSVMVGEAVECGMIFPGNPLKVRFDTDIGEINERICDEGIGHHWMGGYGDVSRELEYFCRLKGIRFIKIQ